MKPFSSKTYLNILQWGIFATFISLLLVASRLFFPYITLKQIYFNIIIEILSIIWVLFLLQHPAFRPRLSLISLGLLSFFIAILVSCFTGVDFNLGFWGSSERMLGWFQIVHFLIYYFIIITVFRTWNDWRKLFISSIVISSIVVLYGIGEKMGLTAAGQNVGRIVSTLGNATYIGSLTIFNIYVALLLFFKEKEGNFIRFFYVVAIGLFFIGLLLSGTRGAYIGFMAGFISILFLSIFIVENKKIKKYCIVGLSIVIIGVFSLIFLSKIIIKKDDSSIINRIISIGSFLEARSMQSRITGWKPVFQEFPSHPFLGTGWGTFSTTFDKHFDSKYYSLDPDAPYLDHAHNNILEILSTTGLIGLTAYLFVFTITIYYIVIGFRKKAITPSDFLLLIALITSYLIQNLVLFDTLISYIQLFMIFGYVYWLLNNKQEPIKPKKINQFIIIPIIVIMGIATLWIVYQYNIRSIYMFTKIIDGEIAFSTNNVVEAQKKYKEVFDYNIHTDREARNRFIQHTVMRNNLLSSLPEKQVKEIVEIVIKEAEKNIKYNPLSHMGYLLLGKAFIFGMQLSKDQDIANLYLKKAEESFNKSIERSPGRAYSYFEKANFYLMTNQIDKAVDLINYGVSLNPKFSNGYCILSTIYFFKNEENKLYESADNCLKNEGTMSLDNVTIIVLMIDYYNKKKDFDKISKLYTILSNIDPLGKEYWIARTNIYIKQGNKEEAIKAAKKAAEVNPSIKENIEQFIKRLQ